MTWAQRFKLNFKPNLKFKIRAQLNLINLKKLDLNFFFYINYKQNPNN